MLSCCGVISLNARCTQKALHLEAVCQMCSAQPLTVCILDSRVICDFIMCLELEVMVTWPGVQSCPLNCLDPGTKHNQHLQDGCNLVFCCSAEGRPRGDSSHDWGWHQRRPGPAQCRCGLCHDVWHLHCQGCLRHSAAGQQLQQRGGCSQVGPQCVCRHHQVLAVSGQQPLTPLLCCSPCHIVLSCSICRPNVKANTFRIELSMFAHMNGALKGAGHPTWLHWVGWVVGWVQNLRKRFGTSHFSKHLKSLRCQNSAFNTKMSAVISLSCKAPRQGHDANHRVVGQSSLQTFAVPACQTCTRGRLVLTVQAAV